MNDNLDDFIQRVSDDYMFAMISNIFQHVFPENNFYIPFLSLAKKYGMPAKNIVPFMHDLAELCNKQPDSPSDQMTLSNDEKQSLMDLLSRSGFMTIGFDEDGDANGNG